MNMFYAYQMLRLKDASEASFERCRSAAVLLFVAFATCAWFNAPFAVLMLTALPLAIVSVTAIGCIAIMAYAKWKMSKLGYSEVQLERWALE